MPAGLSALLKPDAASRGKPVESMEKLFSVAKDLPDSVLADVLAGRSLQVPQYLAMLVATGRKNLRTAMQGVQARAQLQQPSVKDKLLTEEAVSPMMGQPMQGQMPVMAAEGGLASLPAPNMDSVDMADGGIIAFDDGGEVQRFQNKGEVEGEPEFGTPEYDKKYGAAGSLKRKLKGALDYYASPSSIEGVGRNITNTMTAAAPLSFGIGSPSATGQIIPKTGGMFTKAADFGRRLIGTSGAANAVLSDGNALPVPDTMPDVALPKPDEKKGAAPSPDDALKGGKGGGGGASISGMPSYEDLLKRRSTDYLSKFEGMGDKKRKEIEKLKESGLGQFLMNISQGLLSKPGLAAGVSAGLPGAIQAASESRKEQLGRADLADQYDFNIAKAREAAEKGDMQMAMQYAQLSNQNQYQMGMLDMYNRRNSIMGEAGNLGKVQLGLKNADAQALAEAKSRFGNMLTKKNQAAFDDYVRRRAQQLKMENPLTRQYANLGAGDLGSANFNVVQSLPKGASVVDLD
jgi:hypothetical protein